MKNNNFEKLNNRIWKKIAIGSTCIVAVLSVGILATSKAKYKLTESINIVNGTINYKVPDLKVMAMFTSDDGTNYTEITTMPESGYVINEEKTYCTTDNVNQVKGKIKTENGKVILQSLTKGDKCYLYFDKAITSSSIKDSLTLATSGPKFNTIATETEAANDGNSGIYKIVDEIYGGESIYWRGKATTNHVIFANICWRIVRINGDDTMRLIYNGTPSGTAPNQTCPDNGSNAATVVLGTNDSEKHYATSGGAANNSSYVGWTYTLSSQRPANNATGTESNAKVQTEKWYKANITDKGFDDYVAEGLFCNDRRTQNDETWRAKGSDQYYAGYNRLYTTSTPTLDCSKVEGKNDIYKLKVGAITADEVELAGGKNENNTSYYLYNGQKYWTMSPSLWDSNGYANVFAVNDHGSLSNWRVHGTPGIRPVINLRSDITFSSGTGVQSDPYIVN